MGNFDMQSVYDENKKFSFIDLCKEIMDESEPYLKEELEQDLPNEESFRSKFKNSDKSGIIDKLKILLGFDIEKIAESNAKEYFDMLKLLKYLYYIEKHGKVRSLNKKRIKQTVPIIEILSKPRLENIYTFFSKKSTYGKILNSIYDDICNTVTDSSEQYERVKAVNSSWEHVTDIIFEYVFSDNSFNYPEKAIEELNRINDLMTKNIYLRIKDFSPNSICGKGVMKTFLNILHCHSFICDNIDRIRINYDTLLSDSPSAEYVELFKRYEITEYKFDILSSIKDFLLGKNEDEEIKRLLTMISYEKEIEKEEIKDYIYALNKVPLVLSWYNNHVGYDFSKQINFCFLISIMQEIIEVKKKGYKIKNDYFKYNNKCKSMMSALKNLDRADSIVIQAWIKRIENRLAINYGQKELIARKRDIENTIYKIKTFIFSYHNLEDMEFVSEILFNFACDFIISKDMAIKYGNSLCAKILYYTNHKSIRFSLNGESSNIVSFFKKLLLDETNIADKVAHSIGKKIDYAFKRRKFINGKNREEYLSFPCRLDFSITQDGRSQDCLLLYGINTKEYNVEFFLFREICPDEKGERMKALGLNEFII